MFLLNACSDYAVNPVTPEDASFPAYDEPVPADTDTTTATATDTGTTIDTGSSATTPAPTYPLDDIVKVCRPDLSYAAPLDSQNVLVQDVFDLYVTQRAAIDTHINIALQPYGVTAQDSLNGQVDATVASFLYQPDPSDSTARFASFRIAFADVESDVRDWSANFSQSDTANFPADHLYCYGYRLDDPTGQGVWIMFRSSFYYAYEGEPAETSKIFYLVAPGDEQLRVMEDEPEEILFGDDAGYNFFYSEHETGAASDAALALGRTMIGASESDVITAAGVTSYR